MVDSKNAGKRTRAWRRHQRNRMIAKAWRIAKEQYPSPAGISSRYLWRDLGGQWRAGLVTREDVFAWRDYFARRHHNGLAACSCWMCGNPRRFRGERTLQERRAQDSFRDELELLAEELDDV